MEASVKMLVYVVNILMMFAGPASCGEVTEVGLAEAAILHTAKTGKWFALSISCFLVNLISCSIYTEERRCFLILSFHFADNLCTYNDYIP